MVGVDSGYERHVGGNGGVKVRATDLLKEVTRMNPTFLAAKEQLGLAMLRRGDLAGASEAADKLVAADPQAVEGHRLMALVLWRKRDLESSLVKPYPTKLDQAFKIFEFFALAVGLTLIGLIVYSMLFGYR